MNIRDRIKELRRVPAVTLLANPKNWRAHPQAQQEALKGILAEVGIADALIARELPDGSLMLIDGHLRKESDPAQEWPVLVLDVTEAEADKLLATIDPLAAMAEASQSQLDALLRDIQTPNESLAKMLDELAQEHGIVPGEEESEKLKQLDTKPPPRMTWVLLGIPTVRFGEISEAVEQLAAVCEVCETTVNDG